MQVALRVLSPEVVKKVISTLNIKESEVFEEEVEDENEATEENQLKSQDFPTFSQSQGSDTVRVCKMCQYQTQSSEELEMHMESHPTCAECGKRFMTLVNLKKHQEEHEKFQCTICGNEVLSREKADHIQMHVRQDLFKKTLDNGKTLKKPKTKGDVKTTTGYNVFVKTNHSKTKEQNPGLSGDQIRKLVAAEWKSLGVVGQQVYKDMARNGEVEVQDVQVTERVQESQATRQESQGRRNQENRGRQENQARRNQENQLNRMTPGQDQGRIHACNLCGALYSGRVELENHMLMSHSTAGPSPQSQAAVAASVLAVVDAADVDVDVDVANTEIEELPTLEEMLATLEEVETEEEEARVVASVEEMATVEEVTNATVEELATVDEVGAEKEVATEKEVGAEKEVGTEKENEDRAEQVKGIFIF